MELETMLRVQAVQHFSQSQPTVHAVRVRAAARTMGASSPTAKTFVLVHRPRGRVCGEELDDRRGDEVQTIYSFFSW